MVVNYMRYVFCPTKGVRVVANSTAKNELRCSVCGNVHHEAKGLAPVDLVPASSKKKKFKKGKKSKSKKAA